MPNITFISTVHREMGKCNSDELCQIIEKIRPEVIFLEALEETYSKYQHHSFSLFEVFHKKLEISAIQKYSHSTYFEYVPVLDIGLSDAFERKYNMLCENKELQMLVDDFNFLASKHGFKYLNSSASIKLQDEMRILETSHLNGIEIDKTFNADIDVYENSMMHNIYSYCENNQFNSAIFMCGVAHRKSIIEKMKKFNVEEQLYLNWIVFGN